MDLTHPMRSIIPSLEGEIYRVLARTTTSLSGSRIAELADDGSNAGIRVALSRLVEHGTVLSSSAGSAILYTANRDHLLWAAIESAARAADDVLDTLSDRIATLASRDVDPRREHDITIAIYGSVARRDSTPNSDVDVVALFPTPGLTEADESLMDELRASVPSWTGNSCTVYGLTRERLTELVSADDPIIDSWRSEALTVFGPDLAHLIRHREVGRRAVT